MASQQMPRRDPSKKVKEREDHAEADGKKSFGEKGRGQRELVSDRASSGNIVKDKEVEEGRRGGESGGDQKFEMKAEEKKDFGEKAKLEGRTRVVEGKEWNEEEKRRNNRPRGKVEAEKTRAMEKTREEAQRREKDETKEVKIKTKASYMLSLYHNCAYMTRYFPMKEKLQHSVDCHLVMASYLHNI